MLGIHPSSPQTRYCRMVWGMVDAFVPVPPRFALLCSSLLSLFIAYDFSPYTQGCLGLDTISCLPPRPHVVEAHSRNRTPRELVSTQFSFQNIKSHTIRKEQSPTVPQNTPLATLPRSLAFFSSLLPLFTFSSVREASSTSCPISSP